MKLCLHKLAILALAIAAVACTDNLVPDKYKNTGSNSGSGRNNGNNSTEEKIIDYDKYSLGDLAARQEIKLGAAFTYWEYKNNSKVAEILTKEFNAATFGNEMKHDAIVQADGSMNFKNADQMALWTKDAGAELFGHVLGWHSQQQTTYLNALISQAGGAGTQAAKEAIDNAFKTYVYGMVEHFDVYAWDVVNETFSDGTNGAFRTQATTQQGDHVFVWGTYYNSTK